MRRIIASVNVSLDGFTAGPGGELDWHFSRWTAGMAETLCLHLSKADTILLGRNTYNAMAAYWPLVSNDACYPREDLAFAGMMNSYEKVVVSKTLRKLRWRNSTLLSGNLRRNLRDLKARDGDDIMVFGSMMLLRYLLQNNLADELLLWLHPVVLGKGQALFNTRKLALNLTGQQQFSSGVALFCYSVDV